MQCRIELAGLWRMLVILLCPSTYVVSSAELVLRAQESYCYIKDLGLFRARAR